MSDVYNNIELPFSGAKVAGCLCMSVPTKYVVKQGSSVTEYFILQYVTPHIRGRLGERMTNLLGTALLYYVFSPDGLEDASTAIQDRVQNTYLHIHTLPVGMNWVGKFLLS